MLTAEAIEGSRAYYFMLRGEYYGEWSLPQHDQVFALVDRIDGLQPVTHIPSEVVGYACGFSAMVHEPIALINHRLNHSVQEKSDILMVYQEDIAAQLGVREASVLPLKTITLRFEHEGASSYALFTTVGDRRLDRDTKNALKDELKKLLRTEHNPLRRDLVINPPETNPRLMFGIEKGLVSPFVHADLTGIVKGLLYYKDDSIDGFVAFAVSLNDTLVVRKTVFHQTLNWWQGSFLGVPFRSVVKSTGDQSVVNK